MARELNPFSNPEAFELPPPSTVEDAGLAPPSGGVSLAWVVGWAVVVGLFIRVVVCVLFLQSDLLTAWTLGQAQHRLRELTDELQAMESLRPDRRTGEPLKEFKSISSSDWHLAWQRYEDERRPVLKEQADVERHLRSTLSDNYVLYRDFPLGFVLVDLAVNGIIFLAWFCIVNNNLPALGNPKVEWSPAWALCAWFIPFASPVLPYVIMREIWMCSHPDHLHQLPSKCKKTAKLVAWWWTLWLAASFLALSLAADIFFRRGPAINVPTLILGCVSYLVFIVASGSSIWLLLATNRNQAARCQLLEAEQEAAEWDEFGPEEPWITISER